VGKPYIEIDIDRREIARHGLSIEDVQMVIKPLSAVRSVSTSVEGRERYPMRVRYAREYRDNPDAMARCWFRLPTDHRSRLVSLLKSGSKPAR
jgi:copper/silver efflux system protein